MTYFDINMKEIERTKKYFYTKLTETRDRSEQNRLEKIEIVATRDGNSTVSITVNSAKYRLNSLYSPTHEAQRWAKQFDLENIGIIATMFGLGNGVFAREILKRLEGGGALLIYEPCADLFFYIIENYDITDILGLPNVSVTVEGINDNEIKNVLSNHIDWINLRSQLYLWHPQYDLIFKESFKNLTKILQDNNNRTVVNKNTDVALSRLLITNTFRNLNLIKECNMVTDLIGKFPKEVPAIIVAAGPSLDKNIEELKRAKGKAVIFAVDTAMKYLLAHNILPDFIVTLDPKKALGHLSDPRCQEIPIFSRIDSRPENLEANRKNVIFYNLEGYIKKLFEKLGKNTGTLHSGGSVATGAFSICETIGFQRIILVGQDLAYLGDSTHAGGIKVDVSNAGSTIEIVEDIFGNPIKTRYDWYIYIKWFEDAVELFEGEEVIDATEGGAKIKGTTILALSETIDKYCSREIDCEKIVSKLQPAIKEDDITLLKEYLKKDISDLDEIRVKTEDAGRICDKLIEKYEKSIKETNASNLKNQLLSNYNREIEGMDIYELIDWDMAEATSNQLSDLYIYTKDETQDKLATYRHAKTIYSAMGDSAQRVKPLLENCLQSFSDKNM